MKAPGTLIELLAAGSPAAPALLAPGRPALSYEGLRGQVTRTVAALNGLGVGRNDAVAIVLPNGPEMASAFVAIGAGATTAPLNPGYRPDEFEFYLRDLDTRLLVVQEGVDTPALDVARRLGLAIATLHVPDGAPAGVFELRGNPGKAAAAGPAAPDDVALVLHTSGTTSRPKIVPLTHENVCASAAHIAASLALTLADRCLNIMPLFHIHGLVAAVLSSLSAGAGVACTPGFNALQFFAQLEELAPTWYTAVPTMHQAIAGRAARHRDLIAAHPLRLIRSSSASLPPQVMAEVEQAFGAPVIEAYGMTEAAHQMASNPLPPRARKPGSVGVAAGPEVAVMSESGQLLPAGEIGEVVIRGANVTAGYRNNPQANATAFTNGWFRTGDQGVLDAEGYLRLTGRLKEIINRGGEKISPREVDEVLMDHPAVAQVVTFAVPHDKLGEDVAAAVVLKDGASVSERELQKFAGERLAAMKVPRKILFLGEIPKGTTGKLQRIGLAQKLGARLIRSMKICIYGAGAIGGYLGAELTRAGSDVTLIARGAHLEAMRRNGLMLLVGEERRVTPVRCTDDPASVGPQDYVILALKAHSVLPVVHQLAPLLRADTAVVTAQNGILWWYFWKLAGPWENHQLVAADPGGRIWAALGPQRAIGCVVYPSCEIVAPGVVRHIEGNRFMLGEPDGSKSARVTALAAAFVAAGLKAPVRERIRDDIWFKLLGNATFNPVSVLTGATLGQMAGHADGRAVITRMMTEAAAVAARLGVTFPMDIGKRIDGAMQVGEHKTSMLQDFEQGRSLELDALVTAVTELGRLVGVPTPALDLVLNLVRMKLNCGDS